MLHATLLLALTVAQATAAQEAPPIHLNFADLDLVSVQGRTAMIDRIDIAVQNFCAQHGKEVTPQHMRARRNFCVEGMHQRTIDTIPPALRRIYRATADGRHASSR